jgi:hypothetical protein
MPNNNSQIPKVPLVAHFKGQPDLKRKVVEYLNYLHQAAQKELEGCDSWDNHCRIVGGMTTIRYILRQFVEEKENAD